jgi:hypothetical protein
MSIAKRHERTRIAVTGVDASKPKTGRGRTTKKKKNVRMTGQRGPLAHSWVLLKSRKIGVVAKIRAGNTSRRK